MKGTRDLVGIIRVGNGLGRSRSEGRTERENEQKSGRKVRNGRDSDGSGCDPRTVHGVVDTFIKCWEQPPPHLDQTFPHQYFLYRPTPPISKKSHGKPSITIPQPTITNGKPRKGKRTGPKLTGKPPIPHTSRSANPHNPYPPPHTSRPCRYNTSCNRPRC